MSGSKILEGLKEALEYAGGDESKARVRIVKVPDQVDVKAIRENLKMSQREFAAAFGFPLATVQNWEQGRRKPEGSARMLLRIIEEAPETAERVLQTG
ncbi:NadS family protein [Ensifer sesbaniae]|uniref:NadS family protein n=1 Tax=Ensifer sesbaniae TaxID=1214071 RepID=UPI0015692712|nr:NadS family protein [Ensifer sesbaniae]NRQ13479.1 Antitoxin HigA-2 [Ensifer sesbaniae]